MIARTWRGAIRAKDSEAYLEYLDETGFKEYRATQGNRGVLGLRRRNGDRAEVLLITLWENEAAIRRFAGDDIEAAVFYPEDERFLVDRDERANHFDVVFHRLDGQPESPSWWKAIRPSSWLRLP